MTGAGKEARDWQSNWTFQASRTPRWRRRQVLEAVLRRSIRAPRSMVLKPPASHLGILWALYFIYAPNGQLTTAHRDTLYRLRADGFAICVVVATGSADDVPPELLEMGDVVCWKALPGFDFSAYRLGLSELARTVHPPTVLVLNDSVLGPVCSIRARVLAAPWDLTGFTASGSVENHLQSYAFVLRQLTPARLASLRTVLFPIIALRDRDDVIACQETRLGRVAARSMTVGAYWYLCDGDLTQRAPFELMDEGFPFFKRSLVESRSPFPDKKRAQDYMARLLRNRANNGLM